MLDVEDMAMKPTCPTACPLKQKDEIQQLYDQATPFERLEMLAVANFIRFRSMGLMKLSTWILMIKCQRVIFSLWGFFVYADNVIWKSIHQ
jgi:hypothetical protein